MILLSEHIYDFNLDAALEILPVQRRDYVLRYRREHDRRLAVKAYLLLHEGLKRHYGIEEMPLFDYTPKGKPFLVNYPEIHFNMSHCDEAVLCAIDNQPIGVDIECVKPYDEELVQYTMNVQEREEIKQSNRPDIVFTRYWTRKEAVLKRSGEGITNHINDVLTECPWELSTFISPKQNYVYSICK